MQDASEEVVVEPSKLTEALAATEAGDLESLSPILLEGRDEYRDAIYARLAELIEDEINLRRRRGRYGKRPPTPVYLVNRRARALEIAANQMAAFAKLERISQRDAERHDDLKKFVAVRPMLPAMGRSDFNHDDEIVNNFDRLPEELAYVTQSDLEKHGCTIGGFELEGAWPRQELLKAFGPTVCFPPRKVMNRIDCSRTGDRKAAKRTGVWRKRTRKTSSTTSNWREFFDRLISRPLDDRIACAWLRAVKAWDNNDQSDLVLLLRDNPKPLLGALALEIGSIDEKLGGRLPDDSRAILTEAKVSAEHAVSKFAAGVSLKCRAADVLLADMCRRHSLRPCSQHKSSIARA